MTRYKRKRWSRPTPHFCMGDAQLRTPMESKRECHDCAYDARPGELRCPKCNGYAFEKIDAKADLAVA